MGRMTPEELERLKRDVSLPALAESQGRKLKRQGPDNLAQPVPVPPGENAFLHHHAVEKPVSLLRL